MLSASTTKALKQLDNAADNLAIAYADTNAGTPAEMDRLRAACLLVRQIRNAIENGKAYPVSGRAEEFDHQNANYSG